MTKITIFKSLEDAIYKSKKYNSSFHIPTKNLSKDYIIKKSVSSNIFRAFRNLPKKPSSIYRDWANKHFDDIILNINNIKTQRAFDKYLYDLVNSLISNWKLKVPVNGRIMYGPAIKMVNLLFKTIQHSRDHRRENILPFLHVPFDEYSLKPLTNIINQLANCDFKISIPGNVTMQFITNPELYLIIKNAVFNLSRQANIYPIIYDYWSWNRTH